MRDITSDKVKGQDNDTLEIIGDYVGQSHLIHDIVSGMKVAQIVQISKSLKARKLTPPEVYGALAPHLPTEPLGPAPLLTALAGGDPDAIAERLFNRLEAPDA